MPGKHRDSKQWDQPIQQQREKRFRLQKSHAERGAWWFLLAILLFVAGIRYHLLNVPMERDEGEYAYGAQLLLQGLLPYQHLYSMKLPGIYAAYAVVLSIFGQTHIGVHAGLLLINSVTSILIFLLARRLINSLTGLAAAGSFAVLSVSQSVQGVFANAEHFVILPAVAGLLLLLIALEKRRWWLFFASGLLLGLGFIIKQHGIAFIPAGVVIFLTQYPGSRPFSWKLLGWHALALCSGILLPYAVTCIVFLVSGSFGQFRYWTFEYSRAYISEIPLKYALAIFAHYATPIMSVSWPLWILAYIGLSATLWHKEARKYRAFLLLFTLFSFLAICPGFIFRPHYFVLLLPAAAVLAGVGVSSLTTLLPSRVPPRGQCSIGLLITGLALAFTLFQQRAFLFWMSPNDASRSTYGADSPFSETLEIADYIRSHTREDDLVAVIGSEPEIYFYSGRRAATGYVYTYTMKEDLDLSTDTMKGDHNLSLEMQEQMAREIENAQPAYIVYTDPTSLPSSWPPSRASDWQLLKWIKRHKAQYYTRVGLVEIFSDKSHSRWGAEAPGAPRSKWWIEVLKRKTPETSDGNQGDTSKKPENTLPDAPVKGIPANNLLLQNSCPIIGEGFAQKSLSRHSGL
jgi:hypothetical protein